MVEWASSASERTFNQSAANGKKGAQSGSIKISLRALAAVKMLYLLGFKSAKR